MTDTSKFAEELAALLKAQTKAQAKAQKALKSMGETPEFVLLVAKEFTEHIDEINEAFQRSKIIADRVGLPAHIREQAAFHAGVGFIMLLDAQAEAKTADVSQQIVDAIRAIGKTKP